MFINWVQLILYTCGSCTPHYMVAPLIPLYNEIFSLFTTYPINSLVGRWQIEWTSIPWQSRWTRRSDFSWITPWGLNQKLLGGLLTNNGHQQPSSRNQLLFSQNSSSKSVLPHRLPWNFRHKVMCWAPVLGSCVGLLYVMWQATTSSHHTAFFA